MKNFLYQTRYYQTKLEVNTSKKQDETKELK